MLKLLAACSSFGVFFAVYLDKMFKHVYWTRCFYWGYLKAAKYNLSSIVVLRIDLKIWWFFLDVLNCW